MRNRCSEGGLNVSDAVSGKEEGMKAREEREVSQRGEVIVGEVDCVLVLEEGQNHSIMSRRPCPARGQSRHKLEGLQ